MIVMKFGGTSVESAAAIQRVASIVRARLRRRPVVVVSAMGKTTNKLLAMAAHAVKGDRTQALELLKDLAQCHVNEVRAAVKDSAAVELFLTEAFADLEELVRGLAIMGELTPRSIDAISSYGERLSSVIVAAAFNNLEVPAVQVDSRDFILTDKRHTHATPLFAKTYERLAAGIPQLAKDNVVVMGGFIGSTEDGITSTLGRGGSDYTASIVGAGIGAEEIQIWTDVDGMLTADPTVLPGGHRVKTISFEEAAELAYFGAKVLHPSTVLPAVEKNIPVLILNSRRPEVEGTRIVRDTVKSTNPAKSIACKKNVTVLNIHSTRMLMAHGFLRQIFEIFDRYETPVDMVATSEVSVSLTIDNDSHLDQICAELEKFAEVSVERGQAIVCIVGENIRYTPGISARVFDALRHVNVRMISQGASRLNISIVVAQMDLRAAVEALHSEFFSNVDPAVFEAAAVPVGTAG
jgi:aspartate kinase